ncbi:MAG: glutaminyl-peptide cyclotransferase [Bacteroidia bacterium]|nr:glutaminyl-peptide cyclotransferase [Bacteroidia bacterium]
MKKYRSIIYICASISILFLYSCGTKDNSENKVIQTTTVETVIPKTPQLKYTIENKFPHDINSFTEGFLFHDNKLFESTGSPDNLPQTKSVFGDVDLKTGKINVKVELDRNIYFGEGIVFLNDKIFQVTYKNQLGFIYDAKNYKQIGTFNYTNREGWGLTTDGKSIIMSDGTSYLTYFDPTSYAVTKVLDVAENNYVVEHLNELEFINGFIYANIWTTNTIVKIDPNTGNVVAKLDLSGLMQEAKTQNPNSLEMNGIAYDSINKKILVTGKMWPTIYEIRFDL